MFLNEKEITAKEWRFALACSIITAIITLLPYLYGFLIAPADKEFTGANLIAPRDSLWYLSLIEQAKEGSFLFKYLSFPEFQQAVIFHPLFLAMGWIAKIFSLSGTTVYYLFGTLVGIAYFLTSYAFISRFIKNVFARKISLFFLAFSSGFGWIFLKIPGSESIAIDAWMKQVNGLINIYESPLDLAGTILMLIAFLCFLKITQIQTNTAKKYAILCGLSILALLLIHPYTVATTLLTLFLYSLYLAAFKKISIKLLVNQFSTIFLLILPGFWYNYHAISNPSLSFWFKSAATFSPPPGSYLAGLGFLAVFSLVTIYGILKKRSENSYFILIWLLAASILAYQPWSIFQVMFLEGIKIAFAILAAEGICVFYKYLREKPFKILAKPLIAYIIFLTLFTNITMYASVIYSLQAKTRPYYIEKDYTDAFRWIKNNTGKDQVILAHPNISYFIPAYTGNFIFLGLLIYEGSPYHQKKISDLKRFFSEESSEKEKYEFMKKNNISYFLYTPDTFKDWVYDEKISAYNSSYNISNFNPEKIEGLKKVYSNHKAIIYKVE